MGTLCAQLLLQFYADSFQTLRFISKYNLLTVSFSLKCPLIEINNNGGGHKFSEFACFFCITNHVRSLGGRAVKLPAL